ncbi:MAG: NADH-quinone oxidoreductase subunit N [Kofleriaceae bacterium]
MNINPADLAYLIPYLILVVVGLVLVLAEAFYKGKDRTALVGLAVAGSIACAIAAAVLYRQIPGNVRLSLLGGMLIADKTGYVLTALFGVATAFTALMSPGHQRENDWQIGEYYGVMLLSASGMVMLAHASNLVTVFLGIETMSIGVYVMTAMRRKSRRGNEAAMKYFLIGAFATGFLMYGLALLYGAAGTANLLDMKERLLHTANPGLVIAGSFLLVVAFGFKVAAVPFHMWAPDAYEGAPTPVTAFMAAGVKAAAIAAMIRLFGIALGGDVLPFGVLGWASPLVVIAALTITIGNLGALRQGNVKRMLAYSSISHAGVLLVGLCALGLGAQSAHEGLIYYLIAYTFTTMGAFAVVAYIGSGGRERLLVDDWAGLASQRPAVALAMTICLLSLGGIPPTGGLFGKFYVFKAAMEVYDGQLLWLVVIGVVNSAISIYYYLRIVTAMYFRDATQPFAPTRSAGMVFVIAICPLLILEMGLMPGWWLRLVG